MPTVHPTAIVDPRAALGAGTEIGPFAIVRGPVTLGCNVVVDAHSIIEGPADIGDHCRIGPAAFVGTPPQHRKHDPAAETWLLVGPGTIIRENATLHRSTHPGRERATRVGSGCYLMCDSHVAHDCVVGDNVTMANGVLLGGHVSIGDGAFLGGGAGFHQFVRVGRLAMVAGNESISHDVPPFAAARYGGLKGYNAIGCRRAGMSPQAIHALRRAFHRLLGHRVVGDATAIIRADAPVTAEVLELLAFIDSSKRGILPTAPTRVMASGAAAGT